MYEKEITPLILKLKKIRYNHLRIVFLFFVTVIAALLIISKFFPFYFLYFFPGALIFTVISLRILVQIYMCKYKKEVVIWLCDIFKLSFSPEGFSNLPSFRRHKILPTPISGQGIEEDSFTGIYSGHLFTIEELMFAGDEYESKTRYFHYVPRFPENRRWISIRLEMKCTLSGHTIIVPDSALKTSLKELLGSMKKVNIVSSKFEKHYDVLSTDQVEARFLLDPVVIEKFIHFSKILNVNDMRISFFKNELLIVYKDPFPLIMVPSLFRPIKGMNLDNPVIFSAYRFMTELEEMANISNTISTILPKYITSQNKNEGVT